MTTMSKSYMRLHFLLVLLLCYVHPSSFFTINSPVVGLVACHPNKTQSLTQFKNEFDTHHCNHSDPFNEVLCDKSTGAVTMLRLRACLSGTLKPNSSLFGFHQLRYLDLSNNNFISSLLPSKFGNLSKLEVLSLSSNGFLGPIPSSFSNLSMLSVLDLSYNELTGNLPLLLNLRKITALRLSYNHLSGTLNGNSTLFEFHHLGYLDLGYNNFSSKLPSEFGNLTKLEVLALPSSGFFGQVPPTFSNLTKLTELYLDQNKLIGNFLFVQNLRKLSLLELHDNYFSGTIPASLLTMPFLRYIDLRTNNLNGSIEVPKSSSLEILYLGHNHFEGKILNSISKLINLTRIDLSFLNTSHPVDLSLFSSLKSLLYLDLSGNSILPSSLRSDLDISMNLEILRLSGCDIKEFPNMLKKFQSLVFMDISNNKIKGKVPKWLWNLPRLSIVSIQNNLFDGFEGSGDGLVNSPVKYLDLQINNFEGEIPVLPPLINILAAAYNRFTGSIPLSICNCRSLTHLSIPFNNLTGTIPPCLNNLMVIKLRKNNLEGSLPDTFYDGASLQTLDVGYNQLAGKLPRSLLNCSSLEILSVDNNKIEDTFPFWLKALPNLQMLTIRSNKFFGTISPSDQGPLGFPELRILEISDNNFNGSLPPSYFANWKASSLTMNEDGGLYMEHTKTAYGDVYFSYVDNADLRYKGLSMEQEKILTSYSAIDFSGNRFEGRIPESIGLLKELIALNLSNNAFTGHIPSSLANITELESLDLSTNQLSGTIPNGLNTLSFLAFINVSHNQLKGEIPQGTQITGQPKSSFEGNAGLCGFPLQECSFGTTVPPTQQLKEEDDDDEEELFNWKVVAIGYGAGVLLGLAIAQVIASYKPEWLIKINLLNKRRNR